MSLWQSFGPLIGRLEHRSAPVVQCGLLAVRYRLGDCRAKSYLEFVAPDQRPALVWLVQVDLMVKLQVPLCFPLTTRQWENQMSAHRRVKFKYED